MKVKKAGDEMQDATQQLFFTVCPRCNYPHKDARQVRAGHFGGLKGGKAKVPKGFSSPAVLAKALATRRAKAEAKAQAARAAQREAKAKQ